MSTESDDLVKLIKAYGDARHSRGYSLALHSIGVHDRHAETDAAWGAVASRIAAQKVAEVDALRRALADVVDCDWTYLGKDADTGNPDSLYSRIRRGRQALAAASPAEPGGKV